MTLKDFPELKNAILDLPIKDKDKLLLRLINKDHALVEHLHFQLLEDENDLIDRKNILFKKIDDQFNKAHHLINQINISRSHRQLLLCLKSLSGLINYHVQITKDKTSEFELRTYIIQESFSRYPYLYNENTQGENAEKLYQYQLGRLKLIGSLYERFHEDLQADYLNQIETISDFIHQTPLQSAYYFSQINF